MFSVNSSKNKNGIVWDAEANRPLAKFNKGQFETEDEAVATKLKELGYEVEGEFSKKDDSPLLSVKMTVDQIKAYALAKDIELKPESTKAEMVALIEAAEAERAKAGDGA